MIVDLPSDSRSRVQVTNDPSGVTCARLSSYFPASRLSDIRKGRDPSMFTDHSRASAAVSLTIGPFTFTKKSRLLEIQVGVPTSRHGSLQPTGSRWSLLPSGRTSRTSPELSSSAV